MSRRDTRRGIKAVRALLSAEREKLRRSRTPSEIFTARSTIVSLRGALDLMRCPDK